MILILILKLIVYSYHQSPQANPSTRQVIWPPSHQAEQLSASCTHQQLPSCVFSKNMLISQFKINKMINEQTKCRLLPQTFKINLNTSSHISVSPLGLGTYLSPEFLLNFLWNLYTSSLWCLEYWKMWFASQKLDLDIFAHSLQQKHFPVFYHQPPCRGKVLIPHRVFTENVSKSWKKKARNYSQSHIVLTSYIKVVTLMSCFSQFSPHSWSVFPCDDVSTGLWKVKQTFKKILLVFIYNMAAFNVFQEINESLYAPRTYQN